MPFDNYSHGHAGGTTIAQLPTDIYKLAPLLDGLFREHIIRDIYYSRHHFSVAKTILQSECRKEFSAFAFGSKTIPVFANTVTSDAMQKILLD